jgi:hypothetical protein
LIINLTEEDPMMPREEFDKALDGDWFTLVLALQDAASGEGEESRKRVEEVRAAQRALSDATWERKRPATIYLGEIAYPPVLKDCGLYFSQGIVWNKLHPVLTRKDFMGCFELAFYGWREGAGHHFYGPNNALDLWEVKKVNPLSMVHLTEKPVELATRAMEYSSKPGENVLDLFGGSGSTLIAAEQTGRNAYLMELDPLYCDVIVARYEQFTGRKAERVA